ncbi:MAG: zinc dependent phospholipase C family protein, partial [Dehalococcoidia bacterium]
MPNSSLHISFAREAAARLDHPIINSSMGSYLLGSTSPDVRNVAGWDRYRTHFFNLTTDSPGKGIEGLFNHHPELAEMAKLGKETKAFVVGYMSHLV